MPSDSIATHWRDSARTPRFFIIDARGAFPVVLAFFRPHLWTFGLAFIFLIALGILEYFKIPLIVGARLARGWLAGKKKIRGYR